MTNSLKLKVPLNPTSWGPNNNIEDFLPIYYNPFSKTQKIGSVSDWTLQQSNKSKSSHFSSLFSYKDDSNEDDFSILGEKKSGKRQDTKRQGSRSRQMNISFIYANSQYKVIRGEWAAPMQTDWKQLNSFTFTELSQLKLDHQLPIPEDLFITTSEDPNMQNFAKENKGTIFITDKLLSALMVSHNSALPFDVLIKKKDGKLFFDKRPNSRIDWHTFNETNKFPPMDDKPEHYGSATQLAIESTNIYRKFSQQVLVSNQKVLFKDSNLVNQEILKPKKIKFANYLYRYRLWKLEDLEVIVRSEIEGALHSSKTRQEVKKQGKLKGEEIVDQETSETQIKPRLVSIKSLLETNPRYTINWKQNLDTQKAGAFLAELKNNSYKTGRWAAEGYLAGIDEFRIGFISRDYPNENKDHTIYGVQQYTLQDFISRIYFNAYLGWAIFREICSTVFEYPDGEYIILKTPAEPILQIYQIPSNAFVNEPDSSQKLVQFDSKVRKKIRTKIHTSEVLKDSDWKVKSEVAVFSFEDIMNQEKAKKEEEVKKEEMKKKKLLRKKQQNQF
ncbi:eukaryotic translation initiation factor 3 subunit 7 [Anaeramoeba ignava]|uniref:Eukaryotic translation initiation factor 3 subunit 7 n=1 Tax=Anaeramoeba ignava TaxID=1746090 RepID=A0A9Q0LQW8_ANAIG|nr:eukaryotic translation initiation factor 3 subunit 7 [Anaeramoeba ignava]